MSAPPKVILTRRDKEIIRVMSDDELYRDALNFVDDQGTVDGKKQLVSLLSYTQKFVEHQSRRDWVGRKSYYSQYYTALNSYLMNLYRQIQDWFPLPADRQTKAEVRDWNETYAIHVAREFVQHLVFENFYRERPR